MSVEKNDFDLPRDSVDDYPRDDHSPVGDGSYPTESLKDRVVCIPRNENRVLVWWSLTAEGLTRGRRGLEEPEKAKLVLRVHQEDESKQRLFDDYPLQRWLGHRWLTGIVPGTRLSASIGYCHPNGFVQIAGAAPSSIPSTRVRNEPVRTSTTRYVNGRLSIESTQEGLAWIASQLVSEPSPDLTPEAQLLGGPDVLTGGHR